MGGVCIPTTYIQLSRTSTITALVVLFSHIVLFIIASSIAAVQSVTASDQICVLDIDVQGAKSVRNAGASVLDPHYLFIAAPSMTVLEARLRGRCVCVWGYFLVCIRRKYESGIRTMNSIG